MIPTIGDPRNSLQQIQVMGAVLLANIDDPFKRELLIKEYVEAIFNISLALDITFKKISPEEALLRLNIEMTDLVNHCRHSIEIAKRRDTAQFN
jgi:hypothetical protein